MTWVRRAFYVLPLLVAVATVLTLLALSSAGAQCSDLDADPYECNALGDASSAVLVAGGVLTVLSGVVWGVALLAAAAPLLVRRPKRPSYEK